MCPHALGIMLRGSCGRRAGYGDSNEDKLRRERTVRGILYDAHRTIKSRIGNSVVHTFGEFRHPYR